MTKYLDIYTQKKYEKPKACFPYKQKMYLKAQKKTRKNKNLTRMQNCFKIYV